MKVFLQIYNLHSFSFQILTMAAVLKNSILLGQVLPSTLKTAVKVQVPYFVFDPNLKAYFKKTETSLLFQLKYLFILELLLYTAS